MNNNLSDCSNCKQKIILPNRLITDACGHIKCRNCLLSEEFNCQQCFNLQELPPNDEPSKNENGNEVHIIENILINTQSLVKNKTDSKPESSSLLAHYGKFNYEKIKATDSLLNDVEETENEEKKSIKIKECNHIIKELDYFKCKICNKKFRSRNQKYYHLYCDKKNFPYKCDICSKGFATSYHLKYHLETHKSNEKLQCNICDLSFANVITLKNHKLKIHVNNRITYHCNVCDQSYKEKSYYLDHLNIHKNVFPYSCKECEKTFSSKSNLFKHKHYDKEDKKHKCNKCSKSFYRKSSLNNHFKLKHNSIIIEKNYDYQCCDCFKNFQDKKSLARHQNIHTAKTYFQCALCYLTSVRKDNMIRHIKNMHPNEDLSHSINTIKKENNICKDNSLIPLSKVIDEEIKIESSVIRSIGNVKPLKVENYRNSFNNEDFFQKCDNNDKSINQDKMINKKLKKKYDPTEIYRKILFVGNDDSSEPIEFNESVNFDNKDVLNNKTVEETATEAANECTPLSKFSEKHWRKNFTYNYTNNNFM